MRFRKATPDDIGAILAIMDGARKFMEQIGVVQWVNGYP